tara:strand:+ start:165 stop:446 length:282 start_codon:yes stop_codon:yes gene_type:complete
MMRIAAAFMITFVVSFIIATIASVRALTTEQRREIAWRWLSRKWWAFFVVIVLSSVLTLAGVLGGGEWIAALSIAMGVFAAANVAQKKIQSND